MIRSIALELWRRRGDGEPWLDAHGRPLFCAYFARSMGVHARRQEITLHVSRAIYGQAHRTRLQAIRIREVGLADPKADPMSDANLRGRANGNNAWTYAPWGLRALWLYMGKPEAVTMWATWPGKGR